MTISVFDLYTIGIGPSSSHTVGPMRAARTFALRLQELDLLERTAALRVELLGSLGATGRGHGTDRAVVLGLEGETPEDVDPAAMTARMEAIRQSRRLVVLQSRRVDFDADTDLVFLPYERVPPHPNAMRFTALDAGGEVLRTDIFFSIGGGFVLDPARDRGAIAAPPPPCPLPFSCGEELLAQCRTTGLSVSGVMLANERAWRSEAEIRAGLLAVHAAMRSSIDRGCHQDGVLPGGLRVQRRAPGLLRQMLAPDCESRFALLDWVTLFALAVNEENAAGGRVVTAPTNGAAGIVPAVLEYYVRFLPGADDDGAVRFLLAAAAIGVICKQMASISGSEVGCQGEVGSACAMAAAGLAEVLGGSPAQVENAAEIGLEHNLGLTCDPVGGLVQVPCIERNALAAAKAITAANLALRGDGSHRVSLDAALRSMRDIGADMHDRYKETSRGGLAVNVTEC
jgi:L-serine dehydratase